jgi:hypothetical protein
LECELLYNPAEEDRINRAIKIIDRYFLNQIKPKSFNPSEKQNDILDHQRNFEELCSLLETQGVQNPKNKSTMEIFARLSYFKKKSQAKPRE